MAFCLKYFYCFGVCLTFLLSGTVSCEMDVEAELKQLSLKLDNVLTETKDLKQKVENIDNRVKNMEEKLQGIQATTPNSIDLSITDAKQTFRELKGIIKVQAVAVGKMVSREKKILRDSLTKLNAEYAELKSGIQTHMLAFNASLQKETDNIGNEYGNLKSDIQLEMSALNKTVSEVLSITNATLEAKLEAMNENINNNSIMITQGIAELTSNWNSTTHDMSKSFLAIERSMVSNIEEIETRILSDFDKNQNTTQTTLNSFQNSLNSLSSNVSSISYKQTNSIQPELTSLSSRMSSLSLSLSSNISSLSDRLTGEKVSTQTTLNSFQNSLNSLSSNMSSISYKQTNSIQPELSLLSSRMSSLSSSLSSNISSISDRLSAEKGSTQTTLNSFQNSLNSLSSSVSSISYKQTNSIQPELTSLSSRMSSLSSSFSSNITSISDRLSAEKDSTRSTLNSLQNSLNVLSSTVTYTIQPELTSLSSRIASVSSSLTFNVSSLSDRLSKETKIDGGWSAWSAWSSCSEMCQTSKTGTRTRQRQCNNPVPSGRGENCEGSVNDTTICEQQSDSDLLKVKGTRAWQSSTWRNCYAENGIDGKFDEEFDYDVCKCAHTYSWNSYWVMEFECPGTVKIVSPYFRTRSNVWRNTNFTISVYDSFEDAKQNVTGTECITYTGTGIESPVNLSCLQPIYGKALRIQQFLNAPFLQFCEIEVFVD